MKQLIDKSTLVAEIEKNKNEMEPERDWHFDEYTNGYLDALKQTLSFLDTLETKEVDLEKEFYDFLDALTGKDNGHLSEDELFRIAEYFYELGLKTQKGE